MIVRKIAVACLCLVALPVFAASALAAENGRHAANQGWRQQ